MSDEIGRRFMEAADSSTATDEARAWLAQRREIVAANVTLLVSHYEVRTRKDQPTHYAEIERALALNLQLPLLGEVVVLYDHARAGGCERLATRLLARLHVRLPAERKRRAIMRKLSCRERTLRATYGELFAFASESLRTDSLVLLANADIVFDESLTQLPPTPHGHVHTLTVNTDGECRWQPDEAHTMSWDAYAFRVPLPDGLRSSAASAAAFGTNGGLVMNSIHAENRAACALVLGGASLHSACLLVRVRHVHTAPKMHAEPIEPAHWLDHCEGESYGQAYPKGAPRPNATHGEGWPCEYYPMGNWSGDRSPTDARAELGDEHRRRARNLAYSYVVNASVCPTGSQRAAIAALAAVEVERTRARAGASLASFDRATVGFGLLVLPELLILLLICYPYPCRRSARGQQRSTLAGG